MIRLLVLAFLAVAVAVADIAFPAAAGVRSVRDFGAVGDGVADDTAALNKALESSGLLWFPPGTYLVSGQLRPPDRKSGAHSRRILQGADRDKVVIPLADGAAGFGDGPRRSRCCASRGAWPRPSATPSAT